MRVVSFQSWDVVDTLVWTGVYRADINLCREHHSYEKDRE